MNNIKWTQEEIDIILSMKENDKTPLEISKCLNNRTAIAVEKKLVYLRKQNINVAFSGKINKVKNIDWDYFTEKSKEFSNIKELLKFFNISSKAYYNAIKKKLVSPIYYRKPNIEKEREYKSLKGKEGYEFRQKCKFKFNVYNYPEYFDLNLIEQNGWYSAKNRGNNFNGVVRDHIYSIDEGRKNNISPEILSHPANCRLIRHSDNIKKHKNSDITLQDLYDKIEKFEEIYKLSG